MNDRNRWNGSRGDRQEDRGGQQGGWGMAQPWQDRSQDQHAPWQDEPYRGDAGATLWRGSRDWGDPRAGCPGMGLSGGRQGAQRGWPEHAWGGGSLREGDRIPGRATGYGPDYGRDEGRGFFERAGDQIAAWFGDDEARDRRDHGIGTRNGGLSHRGRGPGDYTRSDDRIREDVNDRLTDDHHVDARGVSVSVARGEVTLAGTVPDRAGKRRAEDVAEQVSGVRHVQNNLRIATPGGAEADGATGERTTGAATARAGSGKSGG